MSKRKANPKKVDHKLHRETRRLRRVASRLRAELAKLRTTIDEDCEAQSFLYQQQYKLGRRDAFAIMDHVIKRLSGETHERWAIEADACRPGASKEVSNETQPD